MVHASFGMPTPKYCLICSNHFKWANTVKLFINLTAWGLGKISLKAKLAHIKPKCGKPADKDGFSLNGRNSYLRMEGPRVKDRMLKLIDDLKRKASPRYKFGVFYTKRYVKRLAE